MSMTTRTAWQLTSEPYMPKNRKILLRRIDNLYVGYFLYSKNGVQYFRIDGASNAMPRRADYWMELPQEVYEEIE